jgi:protein involved in polysaccharide export with SLBB domain
MLVLALAGCGMNSIDLPPPPREAPVYRLAPGDRVAVQVFGQQDMSGQFDVNADGMLSLPLVGSVPARDRTVAELTDDLRGKLNRFIVNPQFTVDIVTYRQIFVLGEVSKPGGYPYSVGMTVQQAVALAGGFNRRAITDKVVLTRLTDGGAKDYGVGLKDTILPGDTLDVQRRVF